jgi:hypothetical protein
MSPTQTLSDWYFRCQLHLDYILDKVDFILLEQTWFKYDMNTNEKKVVRLDKDGKTVLADGTISNFPTGTIVGHERQMDITLNLLLETRFMDTMSDIHVLYFLL